MTVALLKLPTPPPRSASALLSAIVLCSTVRMPLLWMPPPTSAALLPVTVQLRSCSVAALKMPPPGASALSVASLRVWLPLTVTFSSVRLP